MRGLRSQGEGAGAQGPGAMTWRAVVLGLGLGGLVSVLVYWNDMVARSGLLVFHLLPGSVLGAVLLLALGWNPVARRVRPGWALGPVELAVIAALGLVACALPDAGFWRTATTNLVLPGRMAATRPAWQSAGVFSYLPGGAAALAPGQVQRHRELAGVLAAGADGVTARLWSELDEGQRRAVRAVAGGEGGGDAAGVVLAVLNGWIAAGGAEAGARRAALAAALPPFVAPVPRGAPLLLHHGEDEGGAAQRLLLGSGSGAAAPPPAFWRPLLLQWSPLALLLGVSGVALAAVVHRQWSANERLPYPIPRLLGEVLATGPDGAPTITRQRLFWAGFAAIVALQVLNGLQRWLPGLPYIPLQLGFSPLRTLFDQAARVSDSYALFEPWVIPVAVAFAFFLTPSVSLSVAAAPLAYVALGAALLGVGETLDSPYMGAEKGNLLRFGAYAASAAMIGYVGRRYYLQVGAAMVGVGRDAVAAAAARWAWAAVAAAAGAVAVLTGAGLNLPVAALTIALCLLTFVVLARITAETGLFYIQAWWLPVGVLTALLGFEALGPTAYLVAALVSTMLVGDTRTALMGYAVNALQLCDRAAPATAPGRRVAPWLVVMVVLGFALAGAATVALQLRHGVLGGDTWTVELLPAMPFNHAADLLAALPPSDGFVASAAEVTDLLRPAPQRGAWPWTLVGAALVLACTAARLRLPWWPIHPVLFLIWGTFGSNRYAFSFLLGGLLKLATVRLAGVRGYQSVIPLLVGVIAGDIAAGLLWSVVNSTYFLATGVTP